MGQATALLKGALPECVALVLRAKAFALLEQADGADVTLPAVVAPFARRRPRPGDLVSLRVPYITGGEWDAVYDDDTKDRVHLVARIVEAELRMPGREFELYDPAALLSEFDDAVAGTGFDVEEGYFRRAASLAKAGHRRTLAALPGDDALAALAREMPNFAAVIEFYAGQSALARLGGRDIATFPPVLLLGPPGVGKTRFAERLAELFGSHCRRISMATATAGWIVTGLDRSWSTGKPGQVYLTLAGSETANCVMLVDELDKASASDSRFNPLGGFYGLLEAETARAFTDEYMGFAIDASPLTWIFSANCVEAIPEPIRSRLVIFEIEPPSSDAARQIVLALFDRVTAGKHFTELDSGVVEMVIGSPPREILAMLRATAGRAARRALARGEAQARIVPRDIDLPTSPRRIGFG